MQIRERLQTQAYVEENPQSKPKTSRNTRGNKMLEAWESYQNPARPPPVMLINLFRSLLSDKTSGNMQTTSLQIVFHGPLLRGRTLRKCHTPSKWPGKRTVLQPRNTHVARTARRSGTGCSSGHLDLDWEVCGGDGGKAANADAGNVLCYLRVLEGAGVGAAGCAVDLRGEGTGTVLVDLVECHSDGAVVGAGGKAAGLAGSGGGGDTTFGCALACLGTGGGCAGRAGRSVGRG